MAAIPDSSLSCHAVHHRLICDDYAPSPVAAKCVMIASPGKAYSKVGFATVMLPSAYTMVQGASYSVPEQPL
jgi:hypothetical protein